MIVDVEEDGCSVGGTDGTTMMMEEDEEDDDKKVVGDDDCSFYNRYCHTYDDLSSCR